MAEEVLARNSLNTDNKGNEPRDKKKKIVTENFFFLISVREEIFILFFLFIGIYFVDFSILDRNRLNTVQILFFDNMFHWWILEALEK